MKQIRLLIAEMLLNWALIIMPEGPEQVLLAKLLMEYASTIAQEHEQELKKKEEDLQRANALARKMGMKKLLTQQHVQKRGPAGEKSVKSATTKAQRKTSFTTNKGDSAKIASLFK